MSNTLQLQLDIAQFLEAHSRFQYVQVICQGRDDKAGDALLVDGVMKILKGEVPKNGKFGLCVIIATPTTKTTSPNAPGPIENFSVIIQIIEHKGNNRAAQTGTGIRGDDLYEDVKRMLHLHSHDGEHDLIVVEGEEDDSMPSHLRGFIILVESKAHALEEMRKTVTPQIIMDSPNLMNITSGTAGAAIYWTLDGSFPSPANAAASLYSAPVDVGELPGGTLIRAVAYSASLRGSDCAFAKI